MYSLHACYHPDIPEALLFFGDDPDFTAPKKRGRRSKTNTAIPHPHAIPYKELISLPGFLSTGDGIPATITADIPAQDGNPLPSEAPGDGEGINRMATIFPAVRVPVSALGRLFRELDLHEEHVRIRDSITLFRYAYGFALECISREWYIPGTYPADTGKWVMFLPPEEMKRIDLLARAMPEICLNGIRLQDTAERILTYFINSCITAVIQAACRNHPLPLKGRARSGSNGASFLFMQLWGADIPDSGNQPSDQETIKRLNEWISPLIREDKGRSFSTCIRMKEPSAASSSFELEFLLQAHDDPSLVISAAEIWKKRTGSITYLRHRFDNPQEQMLADLYTAGKIFPPVHDALRSRTPSGMTLETGMVYPFLAEAVPVLRQSGIPVLLPAWWKDSSKRPMIRLSVQTQKRRGRPSRRGIFTMDALLSFQWEISVGDVTITPEEFDTLVNLKIPLVHIGGKWAFFNPDDVQQAVTSFKKRYPAGTISAMEALRLGLTGGEEGISVEISPEDEITRSFLSPLLGRSEERALADEPVPSGFHGTLRPYQKKGLSWLTFMTGIGLGACLADDMGLGKTIQLIAYLLSGKEKGLLSQSLLICPMSLIGNWQRELSRFGPDLSVYIHHGSGRVGSDAFSLVIHKHDLILSTYQVIARDQELINQVSWDLIVLDEAQNIKNSSTRQAKAVRTLSGTRKIALTGTPVENRLSELWSIMEFLNAGYLGGEKAFERGYSIPIEKFHDKEAADSLQRLVKPFILRRVKTDRSIIADLPEKNIMKRYCTLTEEQATLYQAMVDSMLNEVKDADGIARRGAILTALIRLKQICNHPDAFLDDGRLTLDRSGKIELLFSLLEDVLAAGDAAILFTQFPTFGERLIRLIRQTFREDVLFLHGKTPRKSRDEMVRRFSEPSGPRLFLLSLKAGGVGLNLTRASHVFHIDRWWNPAVEDQATDRAYRIGQQKNVAVHHLISAGTLEERIDQMIEEKRSLAGSIIGSGEDWITSLSTDELRDLFSLRGELIGGE